MLVGQSTRTHVWLFTHSPPLVLSISTSIRGWREGMVRKRRRKGDKGALYCVSQRVNTLYKKKFLKRPGKIRTH